MNKKPEHVAVEFKMRREKRPQENNVEKWWIQVKATPLTEDVEEIKIDLYQTDSDPYAPNRFGPALTPYPMRNGETYTWRLELNDVVAVIVSYRLARPEHSALYSWHVAASGIWKATDGYYFESGKHLKDNSELFY